MRKIALFILLLISLVGYSQEKEFQEVTKEVHLYWVKSTNEVFLTDSIGKKIHPTFRITRVDSMEVHGEKVTLIYGNHALISYAESYIAYDTRKMGIVYLQTKKEDYAP